MVFKLVPPSFCDLCPDFVSERSSYSLRSANNLCLPFVRTERHKKSFLFSSISRVEQSSIRNTHIVFSRHLKGQLLKFLHFRSRNYLSYIGDRSATIFHTRLRLNFSALNYHLFQKNCCPSPACAALSDASTEDVKHYFLNCPRLLPCVKSCLPPLHNYWEIDGIVPQKTKKKNDWLLNGISTADFQTNVSLFQLVQSFISLSNRFC